jgi:hypothetical protein
MDVLSRQQWVVLVGPPHEARQPVERRLAVAARVDVIFDAATDNEATLQCVARPLIRSVSLTLLLGGPAAVNHVAECMAEPNPALRGGF